jgi:ABC-type nitrate/sulfonate/bicarbonate transport system permease component
MTQRSWRSYPLIILVAGIGIEAQVIVVVAVLSILVSTSAGVRSVDRHHLEIAHSLRASRWRVLRSVMIPSLPFILTGVRVGVGRALVGVVVAEFLVASEGIGFHISFSSGMLDTARVSRDHPFRRVRGRLR